MAANPPEAEDLRLRAAVESAPSGLLMVDSEGRIVLVNREVERLFGYPREELLGRRVEMLLPALVRERHVRFREEFAELPRVRAMGAGRDLYGLRKDGSTVPVEIGLTPVATPEGMFILSSIVDITSRKRADDRFRAAVESSPAGMIMVDRKGRILLVNREVERLFGYDRTELAGQNLLTLVPERFRDRHPAYQESFMAQPDARAMGAGRDLYGLRKDGTEVPIEIGLNPIETEDGLLVLASVVDISERKREEEARAELEGRLRQSQKMEAIGRLAGGIAHDFNNILGAIQGYAELLEGALPPGPLIDDLEELLQFVERGKTLVTRIQRFGERHETTRVPISLSAPVSEVLRFLRSSVGSRLDVDAQVDAATPQVLADPSAIHQVLMNLGMNAAQAVPDGGQIRIEVAPFYLADSQARLRPGMREGMHVMVCVRDSGPGIPPEVQSKIFEPFFTTKDPGKGTGLGLAIVDGIVREHEGVVELESEPGVGTTFRILLPAIDEPEAETTPSPSTPRGQGQRILLVDDEPSLVKIGQRRLETLGYNPAAAIGAKAGLELFRSDPDSFSAVISDYLMPGTNGLDFAKAVSAIRPGVPILLLTGFIDALPAETIAGAGIREILHKPTPLQELAEALARHVTSPAKS
ncbi:MAG: PAS domain S-box protein [Gemmatimonadota bacterium]